MDVDLRTLSQVFVQTYARCQWLTLFIEFCEQNSVYVPKKYNITHKIDYCHTAMETIQNLVCVLTYSFCIFLLFIVSRVCFRVFVIEKKFLLEIKVCLLVLKIKMFKIKEKERNIQYIYHWLSGRRYMWHTGRRDLQDHGIGLMLPMIRYNLCFVYFRRWMSYFSPWKRYKHWIMILKTARLRKVCKSRNSVYCCFFKTSSNSLKLIENLVFIWYVLVKWHHSLWSLSGHSLFPDTSVCLLQEKSWLGMHSSPSLLDP